MRQIMQVEGVAQGVQCIVISVVSVHFDPDLFMLTILLTIARILLPMKF